MFDFDLLGILMISPLLLSQLNWLCFACQILYKHWLKSHIENNVSKIFSRSPNFY